MKELIVNSIYYVCAVEINENRRRKISENLTRHGHLTQDYFHSLRKVKYSIYVCNRFRYKYTHFQHSNVSFFYVWHLEVNKVN